LAQRNWAQSDNQACLALFRTVVLETNERRGASFYV
jgi:hypothetical protein